MNNKEAIIVGIRKASDEYKIWLDQAELLVKGNANYIVKKPMEHTDCEFGRWFYSDGQQLSSLSGFKEVESAHQAFHQTYESIYEGVKEVSDSESLSAIKRHISKLENQSTLTIGKLEKIQQSLSEENASSEIEENTFNVEPELVKSKATSVEQPVTDAAGLRRQLQEQDLLQLQQEQQLTELELKHLEDRQRLTTQSTEQIGQYQSLREMEISQQLNDHKVFEESNINNIFLGQQELSRIKEEIVSKQGELEQLALVDQKLEQRKAEEERKERIILDDFERKQSLDKQDIIQLGQQRERWEGEAEKLRQQLMLIKQDLESLTEKESQKQRLIDKSNSEKEAKLQELIQQSRIQDKLNGHKIRVKETKQGELKQLEEERLSKQELLKELGTESAILENQKVDISKLHKKELRELDERQRFKKVAIEKLEQDTSRKQQELKQLVHQQSVIQQSLNQIDLPQADPEKVLEEA
jgi:hypothetical protein